MPGPVPNAVRMVSTVVSKVASFPPLSGVLDQYGSLGPDALQLLKDIQAEALFCSGSPNPLRLTRSSFLHQHSCLWQFENARIVVQWLTMARDKHVRDKVFAHACLS